MDPVAQVFAQQQSGSAGGEGFGQFAVAGMQAGLARRRLALEERQDKRQADRQSMLLPLEAGLLKEQAANLGATASYNKAKLDAQTQQNFAMPELVDLQVRFMQAPDGFSNPALIDEARALSKRYPAAFVPGAPGNDLLTQVLAVPMLESKWQRALGRAKEVPAGMSISLPEGGQVSRSAERTSDTGMQSTVGKLVNDYRSLLNSGDTEGAQFAKAALIKAGQADGLSITFDERGMPVIKQGAAAGDGGNGMPVAAISQAEQSAKLATDTASIARDLLKLASDPANVGVQGNLRRFGQAWGGQLGISVPGSREAQNYESAAVMFGSAAQKLLRTDGQMAEAERKYLLNIIASGKLGEDSQTAREQTAYLAQKVVESAKRQIKRSGLDIPPDLLTAQDEAEIERQWLAGKLTPEQVKAAFQRESVF